MSLFSSCWNSPGRDNGLGYDGRGSDHSSYGNGRRSTSLYREGKDGLLWYRGLGKYGSGEFSMAIVQANQVLEDQCQLESGDFGTFVGVYDGHGGPDAARYVCDHLFRNFRGLCQSRNFHVSVRALWWKDSRVLAVELLHGN